MTASDTNIVLPSEIIYDILLKLHVKTLARFRCVCKSWQALISDPIFIESHHRRSKQNPLVLLSRRCHPGGGLRWFSTHGDAKEFVSMNPQPNNRLVTLPTYLDLVCVYDSSRIYLCNPSIEQLVCLPVESPVYKSSFHQHHVGLGYISSIKKHKLLRIISPDRDSAEHGMDRHCEVFTVGAKNSRWGTVANPPYKIVAHAACVDGVIYMLPHYLGLQPFIPRVCCFDLEKEKWSELQTPCQIHPDNIVHICFVRKVVEECLCLVDFGLSALHRMDVWFLSDRNKSSWVRECHIDISSLSSVRHVIMSVFPLAVDEDGRILLGCVWFEVRLLKGNPELVPSILTLALNDAVTYDKVRLRNLGGQMDQSD
ncbi:putative F-box protein At1g50870 [Asparagus officinalis]|uniref:putative F-box protein At1g50870 n=1 Tax=Asparagus officinalis TaxID=4686 RepID=UPI00098E6675|nr:putative F-box protein At1g50870 [Asparagus officinalis]